MTPAARGFTLIEMAIVLVIITILIGGLAVPLSAQIQARRVAETQKTLEEAKEALIGYAMTHKTLSATPRSYLPCPDTNGDGIEEPRVAHKCPQQSGLLPWVTLGAGTQDAWGNRLHYATHTDVTNDSPGIDNTVTPVPSWNQVCSSNTCVAADIAADVPVVLVSHGPNGWGARNVNGNTLAAPTSANELENLDGDNVYVSRVPSRPDSPSGEFDDLLTWISYSLLFPRVCPTGCLPPP
jgi:prepilin-type N-terminal cleavage/methylation domain-containing protein